MTASLPPSADDPSWQSWEMVSAYVDGVAAPDEIAAVEADPALMARVETMRSVSGALAAPVAPDPEIKNAHLSAALTEFDTLFTASDTPVDEDAGNVRSLDFARAKRKPRRLNLIAAAAAAITVLFAGVVAVGLNSGGDASDTVSARFNAIEDTVAIESSSADALGDSDDAMDDDAIAGDDDAMNDEAMEDDDAEYAFAVSLDGSRLDSADSADAPFGGVILFFGEFDDIDALAAALQPALTSSDFKLRQVEGEPFPTACPDAIAALTSLDQPSLLGRAILDGNEVELHLTNTGDVLLLSNENCTTIDIIARS